jgi:hypothetical protein
MTTEKTMAEMILDYLNKPTHIRYYETQEDFLNIIRLVYFVGLQDAELLLSGKKPNIEFRRK